MSCGFTSHSTQNRPFQRRSQANLLAWYGRTKSNTWHGKTTKAHTHQSENVQQHKNPGNGEGLFWFWRFIKLSLTYLLRHLPTYLQPRNPHVAKSTEHHAQLEPASQEIYNLFDNSDTTH